MSVRFFASMLQMQRENHPEAELMANSLDAMQLATNGSTMHVFAFFAGIRGGTDAQHAATAA